MEEFQIKLLFAIFDKLPSRCLMYIGNYIYKVFKDNYLLGLNIIFLKKGIYKDHFDCYFELSNESIAYLKQELINNDSIIYYFCRYSIICDDKILLNVFDSEIYVIDESLSISHDLIRKCGMHSLKISVENNIEL